MLAEYPVQELSPEEIAGALYKLRSVTNSSTLQRNTRLAKTTLHSTLARQGLDSDFVQLVFYPDTGSGMFYDGLLFFFKEEIKSNQRISNMLTDFGLQKVLEAEYRAQQAHERTQQQMLELRDQLDVAERHAGIRADELWEKLDILSLKNRIFQNFLLFQTMWRL